MEYIVNSFTTKKFASRYDKTLTGNIPISGGFTVAISDVSDLDDEGDLIVDTSLNKWEVIHYISKDDGASTITVPAWGRAMRGNETDHESGVSIKAVPSAVTQEYFDRNYPLIRQGQILCHSGLEIEVLPFNGKMGNVDIAYAGETVTIPDAATTYYWIDESSLLQNGSAYPTTPHIGLCHITATAGVISTVYDDRKVSMASDVVSSILLSSEYSVPNVKAIIDYMAAISSGVISVNGRAGAIELLEGTGITIMDNTDGTFTLSSTYQPNNNQNIIANQMFN